MVRLLVLAPFVASASQEEDSMMLQARKTEVHAHLHDMPIANAAGEQVWPAPAETYVKIDATSDGLPAEATCEELGHRTVPDVATCAAAYQALGLSPSSGGVTEKQDTGRPAGCTWHDFGNVEFWHNGQLKCGPWDYNCLCIEGAAAPVDTPVFDEIGGCPAGWTFKIGKPSGTPLTGGSGGYRNHADAIQDCLDDDNCCGVSETNHDGNDAHHTTGHQYRLGQCNTNWDGETKWASCVPPEVTAKWCGAQCSAAGYCCNDPSKGSNQQISCSQACMMSAAGHDFTVPVPQTYVMIDATSDGLPAEATCEELGHATIADVATCADAYQSLGLSPNSGAVTEKQDTGRPAGCTWHKFGNVEFWHNGQLKCGPWDYNCLCIASPARDFCDRNGQSGCSLEVQGEDYGFCSSCSDLNDSCPHGVNGRAACDHGASLTPWEI